jgi:hypothetical protein
MAAPPGLPSCCWASFAGPVGCAPAPAIEDREGARVATARACCWATTVEQVVLLSVAGVAAAPTDALPPPLPGTSDVVCRNTDTGGTHPLGCWQAGADETPLSRQITHKEHKDFSLVQAARESRVIPYVQLV